MYEKFITINGNCDSRCKLRNWTEAIRILQKNTVALPPEQIERRVVDWCGQNGFAVTTANSSYVIATSDLKQVQGARDAGMGSMYVDSAIADCGGTGIVVYNAVSGSLNVSICTAGTFGASEITVNFIPDNGGSIMCVSNGRVERMIFDALR